MKKSWGKLEPVARVNIFKGELEEDALGVSGRAARMVVKTEAAKGSNITDPTGTCKLRLTAVEITQ